MVLAPERYQDKEYETPRCVLEAAGHTVFTTSTVHHAQGGLGGSTVVDVLLKEVDPVSYDAIVFVGGSGAHLYFDDPTAHGLARSFYEAEKLTTAICAGPSILANAGLLKGKKATCSPSQEENLKAHGAQVTGQPVEQDGFLITANGPMAAEAFGEKIAEALQSRS